MKSQFIRKCLGFIFEMTLFSVHQSQLWRAPAGVSARTFNSETGEMTDTCSSASFTYHSGKLLQIPPPPSSPPPPVPQKVNPPGMACGIFTNILCHNSQNRSEGSCWDIPNIFALETVHWMIYLNQNQHRTAKATSLTLPIISVLF